MKEITAYITHLPRSRVIHLDEPKVKGYETIVITLPDDIQIMFSMNNTILLLHEDKPVILGFEGDTLNWYKYDLIETETDVYEGKREIIPLEYRYLSDGEND